MICTLAAPVAAQEPPRSADPPPALGEGDYSLENPRWNGLTELAALAESGRIELRPGEGLDLSKLEPEDRLIVLYPTRELDRKALSRFVIDGGKILLADDFGASTDLMDRLGIHRVPTETIAHKEFYLGRPGLPVFRPKGRHALLSGVEEVVANHPTALTTRGGAVLPYDEEGFGLVYDMRLARGKVIVVGDASLFINHMLGVADNRAFAANLLEYLCADVEPCRPYLLVGDFALTGTYRSRSEPEDSVEDTVTSLLDAFNEGLQSIEEYEPPHNAVYYASLMLMGGLIVFMVTILPVRRSARIVPKIGPSAGVRPLSEFEWNLQRYARAGLQANYALPVSILKGRFEREFFARVARGEKVPPQGDTGRPAFLRRMAKRYVDEHLEHAPTGEKVRAYKTTLRLLELFSRVPPRSRLYLDAEQSFTERDMTRIAAQCGTILKTLRVDPPDDRSTTPGPGARDRSSPA